MPGRWPSSSNEALRLAPDDAATHCGLGVAYYRAKRYKQAAESFRQAIGLNTDFAEARYNLGMTYLALKDTGRALEQQRLLRELAPDLATALFGAIYGSKVVAVTRQ
jgi:Flp pilus assembly protein TadD